MKKTQISFYHLTKTSLEHALPKLVEKAYATGEKTLLLVDKEKTEDIDSLLWEYSGPSFLPHGTEEHEQICISDKFSDKAKILFCINGYMTSEEERKNCTKILDIFNGKSTSQIQAARMRYKQYKDSGTKPEYIKQADNGAWESV